MSRTINKVEILGRVGVDPEMQYTPGGTAVTKLRLATDRYRKDAEPETDWHWKSGVMEGGLFAHTDSGVPQGGVISPLLVDKNAGATPPRR